MSLSRSASNRSAEDMRGRAPNNTRLQVRFSRTTELTSNPAVPFPTARARSMRYERVTDLPARLSRSSSNYYMLDASSGTRVAIIGAGGDDTRARLALRARSTRDE